MSSIQKLIIAVLGVLVLAFTMVGANKQQTTEEIEASSMIRNYAALQGMATDKCPKAIKKETGEQVYFPKESKTDKDTYVTMIWEGENTKTGGFKKASCTLLGSLGGISELVIDDKVIIKKE